MRKASEVLSGSVEFQFPDVDISGAAGTAKLLALTVRFDGAIQTVREDTLDLIVRARCFGEIRHHASAQVDAHDRSEEHTSELQSPYDLVCRLLLEKKK